MSIVKFWHVFCTISSVSFFGRSGPGPLGPVRKILVVRSGPEGPQFARSVGTLFYRLVNCLYVVDLSQLCILLYVCQQNMYVQNTNWQFRNPEDHNNWNSTSHQGHFDLILPTKKRNIIHDSFYNFQLPESMNFPRTILKKIVIAYNCFF